MYLLELDNMAVFGAQKLHYLFPSLLDWCDVRKITGHLARPSTTILEVSRFEPLHKY